MTAPHVELILSRLEHVAPEKPGQWNAECPAHEDDSKRSLSIAAQGERTDGAVLLCHAGCSADDVLGALDLTPKDLYPPKPKRKERAKIVCTYRYVDERGELLYEVLRKSDKSFPGRRRPLPGDDPGAIKNGWVWSLKGARHVLYRLPEVLAAKAEGQRVYLCEGEKDADNLRALGLVATCNAGGSGKWLPEYSEQLAGADVVLLPDNDAAGAKHVTAVGLSLAERARELRVLDLPLGPRLPKHGLDVSDWLERGNGREDLEQLASSEAYRWEAHRAGDVPPPEPVEVLKAEGPLDNFEVLDGGLVAVSWNKKGKRAISMFRGVPEIARAEKIYEEDEERPGRWKEEEEILYRFRLQDGPTLERRADAGRGPFLDLLKSSELDAATDALTPIDRSKLHKWTLSTLPSAELVRELRFVGCHAGAWYAPPDVCVRAGAIEAVKDGAVVGPPAAAEEFRRYRLGRLDDAEFSATCSWIVSDLLTCDHANMGYTLPLLGAFCQAPLWSYVSVLNAWQRYAFFVQGSSGVGKSLLSRYFWSLWGDFVPGAGLTTWISTATYVEDLLYRAVGVPVFVSDFKRGKFERADYKKAMGLIQAYADRSSRGRAARGTSAVEAKKPPRATWVIDGEDLPEGEQSTLGRLVVLEVHPHGVSRRCASVDGLDLALVAKLPGVTARWIAWVQLHAAELGAQLAAAERHMDSLLDRSDGATNRSRLVRAYAVQDLATRSFLRFLDEEGGASGLEALADRATAIHVGMANRQLAQVASESAAELFLDGLGAILRSGSAYLGKRHKHSMDPPFGNGSGTALKVGLYDRGDMLIWPSVATKLVAQHMTRGGGNAIEFSTSAIEKQLIAAGLARVARPRIGDCGRQVTVWKISAETLGELEDDPGLFDRDEEEEGH